MKKIISVILVLLMLFCFSVVSISAEENETEILVPGVDNNLTSEDEVTSTEDENATRLLGDADGDDSVNIRDATLIQKFVADMVTLDEAAQIYADTDRNDEVNIKDATLIQKAIVGLLGKKPSIGKPFEVFPETYRYYFYMPDEWLNESTATTGNTAGIFWWDGTNGYNVWPGVPAKKGDVEGVYYYDVPTDVTNIVWNNYFDGGNDIYAPYYPDDIQTVQINVQFYWPDESELYPDGLDNFDGMIYVVDFTRYDYNDYSGKIVFYGEWFYYYGNGEYGTSKVRGESEIYTDSALNRVQFVPD